MIFKSDTKKNKSMFVHFLMHLWCIYSYVFDSTRMPFPVFTIGLDIYGKENIYTWVPFKSRLLNYNDFMFTLLLNKKVNANPTSSLCFISDCQIGYYYINCSKPCQYPYYGSKCGQVCSCEEEDCDHTSGCKSGKYIDVIYIRCWPIHQYLCFFPRSYNKMAV